MLLFSFLFNLVPSLAIQSFSTSSVLFFVRLTWSHKSSALQWTHVFVLTQITLKRLNTFMWKTKKQYLTFSIFLVVGVCGNLATCVVIVSNEYLRSDSPPRFNIPLNQISPKKYSQWRGYYLSQPLWYQGQAYGQEKNENCQWGMKWSLLL